MEVRMFNASLRKLKYIWDSILNTLVYIKFEQCKSYLLQKNSEPTCIIEKTLSNILTVMATYSLGYYLKQTIMDVKCREKRGDGQFEPR